MCVCGGGVDSRGVRALGVALIVCGLLGGCCKGMWANVCLGVLWRC